MSLIDAYPTQSEIVEGRMRLDHKGIGKMTKSESDPIGLFFVTYSAGGEKLLFRYPYEVPPSAEQDKSDFSCNRFIMKDSLVVTYEVPNNAYSLGAKNDILTGYSDKVLANLLVPTKPDFCGQKFEVKINDIIFVGFPTVLNITKGDCQTHGLQQTDLIFNTVFALRSWASPEVIATYQDLSKQLALALCHEEHRTGYTTTQKQIMLGIQDDCSASIEADGMLHATIFEKCLEISSLARCLRRIYEDICSTGVVKIYVNSWIAVSLCLEPKIKGLVCQKSWGNCPVTLKPQVLQRCIKAIRPYHAMLLTEDERILIDSLPIDSSPALVKLIRVTSPLKNLQSLASEADIDLRQVIRLVASLVYWGKAMIVFPLCETNHYMVAPKTNTAINSVLALRFQEQFPCLSLPLILAEFSLPCPLKDHREVLCHQQNPGQDVQVVMWLLRNRLISQIHTFVYLYPNDIYPAKSQAQYRLRMPSSTKEVEENGEEDEEDDDDADYDEEEDSESSNDAVSNRIQATGDRLSGNQKISAAVKQRHHQQQSCELFVKFTPGQRQSIFACAAATNEEDLLLLERLSKYFNGQFHLEAIMFYENMRRSQLVALIDKFRDVLLITQHDEADISYWIYS